MKKIILALIALCTIFGCTKFEHDPEFQKVVTGAPVISKTDSTQTSLSAIVSAADKNTSYYSYAVLKGGKSKAIDAATLLSDGYSKSAVVSACISVKDSASTKVVAEELSKGETYTLYAVAASTNGVVSEISTHVFILDDKKAPAFSAANSVWEMVDSVLAVAIPFDRDIKLAENAKVTINGWAVYHSDHYTLEDYEVLKTPANSVVISGQNLQVMDNYLGIIIPASFYTSGKVVTVNFDAGTVVSLPVSEGAPAGNPCVACKSEYVEYGTGEILSSTAIGYRYPTKAFPLDACDENPKYVNYKKWDQEPFKFAADSLPSFFPAISVFSEGEAQAVYTIENAEYSSERKSDITVSQLMYSESMDTAIITLPTKPAPMEYVGIDIPEGTFEDIFGNPNKAVTMDPILTVDGTLDFVYGDVVTGCNNAFSTITPGAEGLYFTFGCIENLPEYTDDILIGGMKSEILYWAKEDGLTFAEEYIKYYAYNSAAELSSLNLDAETDYIYYAFYMTADGTVLSSVFRKEFKTAKFEIPTETTGTFTYGLYPLNEELGSASGLPVSFNAAKDTLTISGYGKNKDMKCLVDKSGNIKVLKMDTGVTKYGYNVIIEEIETWNGGWSRTSYYDSNDKTIHFSTATYCAAGWFDYGYSDSFCFDGSQPSAGLTSVSSGVKATPKNGKITDSSRRHHSVK